jgi:hypothetical protein
MQTIMEFSVCTLRAWAVPLAVPIAGRVFDSAARIPEESVEGQLDLPGREVARVADRFGGDEHFDRQDVCARAAKTIAGAA